MVFLLFFSFYIYLLFHRKFLGASIQSHITGYILRVFAPKVRNALKKYFSLKYGRTLVKQKLGKLGLRNRKKTLAKNSCITNDSRGYEVGFRGLVRSICYLKIVKVLILQLGL